MAANLSNSQIFFSALIGGTVTAVLYPMVKYFFVRWMLTRKVKFALRIPDDSPLNKHISLPLRISNKSVATVKGAVCFVYIEYQSEDIVPAEQEPNIIAYHSNSAYQWLALSWARVTDDKIRSVSDLNVGEEADLNVFRYHARPNARPLLQLASEQGFFLSGTNRKGRVLLFADKDYLFKIMITGENIFPVTKSFRFNHSGQYIEFF